MSTTSPTRPAPPPDTSDVVTDPKRRRLVLAAVLFALTAVVASVSGLNVALGQLAADLGAGQGDLLWVVNGYTIALAALLLPIGAIGDRWGRQPVLLGGLGAVPRRGNGLHLRHHASASCSCSASSAASGRP